MAIKTGDEIFNAAVTAGTAETTLGPYDVGDNIGINIDGSIINGATPPASVPLLLIIEWNREAGGEFGGEQFQGSLTANEVAPITNFPIPYTAHQWRAKYTAAPDVNVTLKLRWGAYEPS